MHFVEARAILTGNGDIRGINVYRGCTHGCIYCDSRSACYRFTHPFEDVEVKRNAPQLLARALRSMRRRRVIGTGSMSDPYMHCETELMLTRQCLEVIHQYGFGAAVQTKSDRILRDIDLLEAINERAKCVVQITLTTWDDALCAIVEPNVCNTRRRLEVLQQMAARGIPTMVWLTPLLPFINDTEANVRRILEGCAETGVKGVVCFDMGMTLREGDREYYYAALDRHFPGLKRRYAETYGNAYQLASPNRDRLMSVFHESCEARGILHDPDACFAYMTRLPDRDRQLTMFD